MIEIQTRRGPFKKSTKWFVQKPVRSDAYKLVQYNQCQHLEPIIGFHRTDFYTIVIDLGESDDGLLANCGKNTRYKINRAKREGVGFNLEDNLQHFANFYNTFAQQKSLAILQQKHLESLIPYLHVTKATLAGDDLVMHSYLVDKSIGKARLLHSASHFRQENKVVSKNTIGRANRFLHFEDIIYFKKLGYKIYDFGGYALNTNQKELQQINEFKEGFGGLILRESHYLSIPLYCLQIFNKN